MANVLENLNDWQEPIFDKKLSELIASKLITVIEESAELLHLEYPFPIDNFQAKLMQSMAEHLKIEKLEKLKITSSIKSHSVQQNLKPLAGIKNIIAVASGKGGVGKSTTAVNLSIALANEGAKVGLLDADIYGPSIPTMLGMSGQKPESEDGKTFIPLEAYGVKTNSIGFLIGEDQPVVWRGPMVTQMLNQLLTQTQWGELDYLIVDMPPGTGDTQLTLSQRVPLSGAVIVTTPQDIALLDAKKGLQMFNKVNVRILGIVENMAAFICPHCGEESAIFGSHGGQEMAKKYNTPLLASVPLTSSIREQTDIGKPTMAADTNATNFNSDSEQKVIDAYQMAALRMLANLAKGQKDFSSLFPKIVVENT